VPAAGRGTAAADAQAASGAGGSPGGSRRLACPFRRFVWLCQRPSPHRLRWVVGRQRRDCQ